VWAHLACALPDVERLEQLAGWDRMAYDAIRQVRDSVAGRGADGADGGGGGGAEAGDDDTAEEAALRAGMEAHEALQNAILTSGVSCADMTLMLECNGMYASSLRVEECGADLAVCLADGLANGAAEDCPACGMAALVCCAGRVVCWNPGDAEGHGACEHTCPAGDVARYRWRLPPNARIPRAATANWLQAVQAAALAEMDGAAGEEQGGGSAAAGAGGGSSAKRQRLSDQAPGGGGSSRAGNGHQLAGAARRLDGVHDSSLAKKVIKWVTFDV